MNQIDNRRDRGHSHVALLIDGFGRVDEALPDLLAGLGVQDLVWRPDSDANPIGWLVWHLTRVLDDHVAGVAGVTQVWMAGGWAERFGLPYPEDAIGFEQTSAEVGSFTVKDPSILVEYWAATFAGASQVISAMQPHDLRRVVDGSYDPPVTVAIRLVSVLNDITQHVGQAAYVRGLVERRRR